MVAAEHCQPLWVHPCIVMTIIELHTVNYIVLLIAKQITKGSKIGAGYVIDGQIKRHFRNADFCTRIAMANLTCPLQPGS